MLQKDRSQTSIFSIHSRGIAAFIKVANEETLPIVDSDDPPYNTGKFQKKWFTVTTKNGGMQAVWTIRACSGMKAGKLSIDLCIQQ